MPKFNVLLKDDKTYPYIKINVKADYPDLYITRRILNDGAKYFGPYPSAASAKEMISFLKDKFKIRQCRSFKYKDRPCLNYHIKKCLAPCMGYVSKEAYREQVDQIVDLLEGKTDKIRKQLEAEMKEEAQKQNYEKAAELRDRIIAIERVSEKQKVSNLSENNIDVIGIARNEVDVCLEIFFIRNSKMIGREHYFLKDLQDEEDAEILASFIKQYYNNNPLIPSKIMMREELAEKEILEVWLTNQVDRKVELKTPQKGEKLRLVEMAEKNAKITLENKDKEKYSVIQELKEVLGLEKLPRKIECFDISNISGEYMVAGMCVMIDGVIKKNLSRRFKIKTVFGQDDPRCMNEVIKRRIRQSQENPKGGFGSLPDLILVDGGITQMKAAKEAVRECNAEIPIFGMVKNDKHRTRALMNEERKEFEISEDLKNTITRFQDAVHDTAIRYHRKLRDESMTQSSLDQISGIGTAKKAALLKHFGSVKKIGEASVEELMQVKGINENLAKKIKEELL